jgi:hypothetical protein
VIYAAFRPAVIVVRVIVRHAMQTADGQWRVEVIQRGSQVRYRLIHGDDIREPIAIGTIAYELAEAGLSMADLIDVTHRLAADTEPATP